MIGKVTKAGRGFKGLVNYLLKGEKGTENNPARVAWTAARNLTSDDPELAARLMEATASQSRRCRAPTYHFVISWRHDEPVTDQIMEQVADMTCSDLDLDDHQRLYVSHADTRHRHLHVVVNRVHPETLKAWNRRQDWVRIEQSLADQSKALGLEQVPGRHNGRDRPTSRRERDGEYQLARRRKQTETIPQWSKERIETERGGLAELFDTASSWDDLEDALADRDIVLADKGQGMVLADAGGTMKVSSLGKSRSLRTLEERLGERRQDYLARRAPTAGEAERSVAFAGLNAANQETDFAVALYRFGMINQAQLHRHFAARERAASEVKKTLTFSEQVAQEVAQAMRQAKVPGPAERPKPKRRREREDDWGR